MATHQTLRIILVFAAGQNLEFEGAGISDVYLYAKLVQLLWNSQRVQVGFQENPDILPKYMAQNIEPNKLERYVVLY